MTRKLFNHEPDSTAVDYDSHTPVSGKYMRIVPSSNIEESLNVGGSAAIPEIRSNGGNYALYNSGINGFQLGSSTLGFPNGGISFPWGKMLIAIDRVDSLWVPESTSVSGRAFIREEYDSLT